MQTHNMYDPLGPTARAEGGHGTPPPGGGTFSLLLLPTSSFHTSAASSLWMTLDGEAGRRYALCPPLSLPNRGGHGGSQESSIYSRLTCTGGGSGQPTELVQDVKLWEMPDCYHCQIQFPPTASAPPPGPWCPSVYGNNEVLAGYF